MKWPILTIGELSEQVRGVSYAKGDATDSPCDGFSPILRANNIGEFGLNFDKLVYIPDSKIKSKQRILINDVIVAASSGSISVVGKAAQARNVFEGAFGAFCKVLRPGKNVDPRYFGHYFRSHGYRRTVSNLATGANINNLKNEHLDKLQIPLPPLAEQKRIAGILDAADALRARRRESLAQLDTLLQATFLDMFGDPVLNPMGWETVPFKEIGEFISGATPSKARDDYWDGTTPWVSPKEMKVSRIRDAQDHVSQKAFEETNLKLLNPGHLLIVVRGMILAHSFPIAFNIVPVAINQDMKGIRPKDDFSLLFLAECIHHLKRQILSEVSTAAHGTKRLDAEAMKKIDVPVPPLDLQRRFAAIVEAVERQKARQRAHLAELDTLFAALQQRAFAGEL